MIKLLAFKKLERNCVVFAGDNGIINSAKFVHDPSYIIVPAIISNNSAIIYYSFDNGPFKLYRIRKSNGLYTIIQSTGSRKCDAKKLLSDWMAKCT